jgi:hypothetical protein
MGNVAVHVNRKLLTTRLIGALLNSVNSCCTDSFVVVLRLDLVFFINDSMTCVSILGFENDRV